MKYFYLVICLLLLSLASCTKDADDNVISGTWVLTEWQVETGFDMNSDGVANTNILNEIDCINNETLVFETKGVVISNNTFNPDISIALKNGTLNDYIFNITCDDEGVISYATPFDVNGNTILIGESIATLNGHKLTRVFVDAIKIYNQDFTQILRTENLIMVYTKL